MTHEPITADEADHLLAMVGATSLCELLRALAMLCRQEAQVSTGDHKRNWTRRQQLCTDAADLAQAMSI